MNSLEKKAYYKKIKEWILRDTDMDKQEKEKYRLNEFEIIMFKNAQIDLESKYNIQNNPDSDADYYCNRCCDVKVLVTRKQGLYYAKDCDCVEEEKRIKEKKEQQRRLERRFKSSRISKANKGKTFDDFKALDGKIKAKNYGMTFAKEFEKFKNGGYGITFTGDVGVGKTMLVEIMAQYIMKKGYTCLSTTAHDLWLEIADTYSDRDKNTIQVLNKAKNVDLLILDNLNSVSKKNFNSDESNKFFNIINYRYNEKLPTIVTTTSTMFKLQQQLSPDLIDRLEERNALVNISGANFRKQKRKEADLLMTSLINKL